MFIIWARDTMDIPVYGIPIVNQMFFCKVKFPDSDDVLLRA